MPCYRLMPFDMRGYFLWPFGAWAMYCGARLTTRVAVPLVIGGFFLSDVICTRDLASAELPLLSVSRRIDAHRPGPPDTFAVDLADCVRGNGQLRLLLPNDQLRLLAGAGARILPPLHVEQSAGCYREGGVLRYMPGHIIGLGDVLPGLLLFEAARLSRQVVLPGRTRRGRPPMKFAASIEYLQDNAVVEAIARPIGHT